MTGEPIDLDAIEHEARDPYDGEVDRQDVLALVSAARENATLRAALTAADTLADAAERFIDAVVLTGGLCFDALAAYREGRRG